MQIFIDSIRKDIESLNWHSALALTLTLPDICGKIEHPTEQGSGARYERWFNHYVKPKYELGENSPTRIKRGITHLLSGKDVYALRCSYLHEGSDVISVQRVKEVFDQFQFSSRPGIHRNVIGVDKTIVQLNISEFCNDILSGVEQWLRDIAGDATKQAKLATRINIDLDPNQAGGISFGPAVKQEFKGRKIILDGNHFIDCTFEDCQLVFRATAPHSLQGCTVSPSSKWELEGSGALTVDFLRGIYKDGQKQPVEEILNRIRN